MNPVQLGYFAHVITCIGSIKPRILKFVQNATSLLDNWNLQATFNCYGSLIKDLLRAFFRPIGRTTVMVEFSKLNFKIIPRVKVLIFRHSGILPTARELKGSIPSISVFLFTS